MCRLWSIHSGRTTSRYWSSGASSFTARQHTIAAAMNDTDLCWMSAADLAAAIAKKKVSPVEVVDATLARIDKLKELNAYVTLDADGARKAAKAAERAVGQRGVKLGPLHGVPFSVKDLIITKGIRTTFGTPLYP